MMRASLGSHRCCCVSSPVEIKWNSLATCPVPLLSNIEWHCLKQVEEKELKQKVSTMLCSIYFWCLSVYSVKGAEGLPFPESGN